MSDPRPYHPTEWEEDQKQAASDAVRNADAAVAHADTAMEQLVRASEDVAANSKAVENLTREAIIADNKKFRRRNGVLVFLTCVLISGMGYMIYRDVFVNSPARVKIEEQTSGLQDANDKLDAINTFIEDVQANDGDGVTRQELQIVFDAVFETKATIEETQATINCVLTAPSPEAARSCGQENL